MNKILLTFLALAFLQAGVFTQWSVQTFNPGYGDSYFLPNSNTGWVVGEHGTIRKTTDTENWVNQYSGLTNIHLNAVHFVDAQTGWAAGENGIVLRTTNGGNNWIQQTTGTTNRILDISFLNANTGIAGMQTAQLLRTTNGGTNWVTINITGASGNIIYVNMKYDVLSYISLGDSRFMKSTDSGVSWSLVSNSPTTISDIHFATDSYGFASTYSGNVIKTTNGGSNWTLQVTGSTYPLDAIWFLNLNTGVTVASDGKVYNTVNGGTNWQHVSDLEPGITRITNVMNNALLACGNNGTLAYGNSFGDSWGLRNQGTGADIKDIYFMNNQTGWAANEWDQLLYTSNSGSNWSLTSPVGLERLEGVCFTNNNTGYVLGLTNDDEGGSAPTINKTTNGGSSWQEISFTGSNPMSLQFVNNNDGFMLAKNGANSVVHRTTNAGVNWSNYTINLEIYDCYFTTQSNGWMCGKSGVMMRSTDGGATWGTQSTGVSDSLLSVYFRNASFGCACGTNGRIITTTNGGINWSTQTSGTNKTLTSIEFGSTIVGAVCGLSGTRLTTINGGVSWTGSTEPSQADLYTVCFTPGNTAFLGGDMGYISAISGLTLIEPVNNSLPSEFVLKQNYPNPFNPVTSIDFSLPAKGFTSLEVYDITGRIIKTLVSEEMNAGNYSISFDAGSLATGVYFYKLHSPEFTQVKKMMLIK